MLIYAKSITSYCNIQQSIYDVVRNEDILKLPVRLGANKLLSNIASIIIQGVSYYEQCFIYHNKNYSAQ